MNPVILMAVASVIVCVVAHESAHALALRSLGYRIEAAGIGVPARPMLTIPPRGRRTFALTISPWLVMGYVMPDDEAADAIGRMPYRDAAWFDNAGIVVNLLITGGGIAVVWAARGEIPAAVVMTGITAGIWFGRRVVAAYLLPVLSVPALALVAYGIVDSVRTVGPDRLGFGGMGGLPAPADALGAVTVLAAVSFALALINSLPLLGLDNGRVVDLILERYIGRWALTAFRVGGGIGTIALVGISFGSDLLLLLEKLLHTL